MCASVTGAVLHFNFLSGGTVIVGEASEIIRIIGDPDNRGSTEYGVILLQI